MGEKDRSNPVVADGESSRGALALRGDVVGVARLCVLVGLGVVAVAAFGLSAAELDRLARDSGWSSGWAVLFPVSIDVYALICTVAWLVLADTREDRRRASAGAVAAVAISVAGNTVEHLHQAGILAVAWPVIVAVSAVPPIVMALAVHVAVSALPSTNTTAVITMVPEREGARASWQSLDEEAKLRRTREAARSLQASGKPVTGAALAELVGVTDRTGRTYLRKIQASAQQYESGHHEREV